MLSKIIYRAALVAALILFTACGGGDDDGRRLGDMIVGTWQRGWGEGDEFVPKTNTILIDGKPAFTHTPWRQDCGCYRYEEDQHNITVTFIVRKVSDKAQSRK